MSTTLRQRNNYVVNPRAQARPNGAGVLSDRRRNRFLNPRQRDTGAAPTAQTAGTVGTVTRSWVVGLDATAAGFPPGVTTARQTVASGLGSAATNQAGEYVDLVIPAALVGKPLTVSAYARRSAGGVLKRVRLSLEPRSATAATGAVVSAVTPTLTDTVARRLAATVTPPATTTVVRVSLWVEGSGATGVESVTVQWTAILAEEGKTARSYFDGATTTATTGATSTGYAWEGTANAATSILYAIEVEALTLTGDLVRAEQPLSWQPVAADPLDVQASFYLWKDGLDTVVRLQPYDGGDTAGPLLWPEDDLSKPATFAATLLVEARLERATVAGNTAAALRPVLNGTAVSMTTAPALTTAWQTIRVPVTLNGGAGASPRNTLRLGKTGTDPVLVRSVALVDVASYAGAYFDGTSPTVGVLAASWTSPHDAPNSASYLGIPSVSLTAAAEAAIVGPGTTRPPRVHLEVKDADPLNPLRAVILERVDSGGRRTPVRGPDGDVIPLAQTTTGSAVTVYDYEAPLGEPATYVLVAEQSAGPVPFIPAAKVTPDDSRPWLVHPGIPARSRPLAIVELGRRRRRVVEGIHDVAGRADPIVRTDGRRKSAESTLTVRTYTDAERLALDALLDDAAVLLLNVPPRKGLGVTYEWVAIGESSEDRAVPRYGRYPARLWPLPFRVVGRPVGGSRSARTWHDVAGEAASWAELARQPGVTTWDDVADPPAAG